MTVTLERSTDELVRERSAVLADVSATEEELRERATEWRLTAAEARALRRLEAIDFLLSRD